MLSMGHMQKARGPTDCFLEDGEGLFLDPPRVSIWLLSGKQQELLYFTVKAQIILRKCIVTTLP